MGKSTVKLVHRTWDDYHTQVEEDAVEMRDALMRWLEGKADASPQLQDAAELRQLVQCESHEEYYIALYDLAGKREAAATPAVSTVGQLIEQLQGLDPELPISLVVGGEEGHIDKIEVSPSA